MSWSNLGLEISLLPTTKDNLSTVNAATSWSGEPKTCFEQAMVCLKLQRTVIAVRRIRETCGCWWVCQKTYRKMLAFLDWSLLHSAAPQAPLNFYITSNVCCQDRPASAKRSAAKIILKAASKDRCGTGSNLSGKLEPKHETFVKDESTSQTDVLLPLRSR